MPEWIPNRRARHHGDPEANRPGKRNRKVKLPKTKTEPALVRGVVVALLGLLASLGVGWAADVDKDTIAAITTALLVLLPILQAAWTRFAVTANAKVLARLSVSQGTVVAGEAATARTGHPLVLTENAGAVTLPPLAVDRSVLAPDERGESALHVALLVLVVLVIVIVVLNLAR